MANRIDSTFARLKKRRQKALIGYLTAGYPTLRAFRTLVPLLQESGLDILEIGVPFSDPIADGPTIQRSSQIALRHHVTLKSILSQVRQFRQRGVTIPFVIMTYGNPVHAMGIEKFFALSKAAGVDGVILPDIIPEEAAPYEKAAKRHQLHVIHLVTPATPRARAKQIVKKTRGFLYAVSLTGVTGTRKILPRHLKGFLSGLKRMSKAPVAVGFGISTPSHVRELAPVVDGVIIGSALIQSVTHSKSQRYESVGRFVRSLKGALHAS